MNNTFTLDMHDCQLIRHFKHSTPEHPVNIDTLKAIWGNRCGMSMDYVNLYDITDHLLDIVWKLNLLNTEVRFGDFIRSLDPINNWKFTAKSNPYKADENEFQMILLMRLDSLLSLTVVDELPGYRDYLTSIGE